MESGRSISQEVPDLLMSPINTSILSQGSIVPGGFKAVFKPFGELCLAHVTEAPYLCQTQHREDAWNYWNHNTRVPAVIDEFKICIVVEKELGRDEGSTSFYLANEVIDVIGRGLPGGSQDIRQRRC